MTRKLSLQCFSVYLLSSNIVHSSNHYLYCNFRSNSPESGISTSHLSINDAEFADEDSTGAGDDDEFEDSLAALGTGKALYPFEGLFTIPVFDIVFKCSFFFLGLDEGSIKMAEGEEFEVVELDQGDGWTRVRRMNNANYEEGFVPTSYIECVLFEK